MRRRRYLLLSVAPLALVLGLLAFSPGAGTPPPASAGAEAIPGRYIVLLKDGVNADDAAGDLGRRGRFQADVIYRRAVHGFAAEMTGAEAEALARDPSIALVEPDKRMSADLHTNLFQTVPTGVDRIDADQNATADITNTPGGADLNIDIAVIDTGVETDHPELNVAGGVGFTGSANCDSSSYEDDNGHGTHVSGTIAAIDNDRGVVGVAPGARIWAVKVLDANGEGWDSCVIAGIDWVTDRRAEYNDGPSDGDPGINIAVANMSLGGDDDPAICAAIDSSTAAGVIHAVAAGNSGTDDSNFSPANCSSAITVSAFGDFDGKPGDLADPWPVINFGFCTQSKDDYFACFSSYGPPVDIAAPGVNIVSTYKRDPACGGAPCYATLSGTSMATPHVTGALALFKLATGYAGPADAADVMAAFTAAGYTRPQDSSCGFGGDPDSFHEPVLYVGSGCPGDADGDGIVDPSDNCPAIANPGQENNVHPATPAGDACEDPDTDGIFDVADDCPDWANPLQNLPNWTVPAGDTDCDGWTNADETAIGTDPAQHCAATAPANDEAGPDVWPSDFDDNQKTGPLDVLKFTVPVYGSHSPGPPYSVRFDWDGNGAIGPTDVLKFVPVYGKTCV